MQLFAVLLLVCVSLCGRLALGEVKEIDAAANLAAEVGLLGPGDELVLQGGTYTLTSRFRIEVTGTAAAPIVIRAKSGEQAVIRYPSAGQNVINIERSQHLILRDLEVTGGSHGIRMRDSSFITIENCHIHDTGDVALSANIEGGSYQGLRLLRNHIHDTDGTGEGMYLGCNNNDCQVFDSLIEGNYIHHTDGAGVSQGDGIELKEGSFNNIIRDNVIHNTNYPCILAYSTVGNGTVNLIERNIMWGCGDHAIQVAADATVRNNIILGAVQDGIRSQPHQAGIPANLMITHNTILNASNAAVRVSNIAGSVVIANNALYAQSGPAIRTNGNLAALVVSGNVGSGYLQGLPEANGFDDTGNLATDLAQADYTQTLPLDVYPTLVSRLRGGADASYQAADDFNGTPRTGAADAGAYHWTEQTNPGWVVMPAFKRLSSQFFEQFFDQFEAQAGR